MVCKLFNVDESESRSVVCDSLQPHGLYSLWHCPGQNTGVGVLSLLQGIFPTPRSPALQVDSLPAEPHEKPKNTGVGSLSLLQWPFPTLESPSLQADSLPTEIPEKSPGSIPGLGRSPGEGNSNPLQFSCLENLMDKEA